MAAAKRLDRDSPDVKNGPNYMLVLNRTTKTITQDIHEEPEEVLSSLRTATVTLMGAKLHQVVLRDSPSTNETIVYWTFLGNKKECNLLLKLKVEKQEDGEIRIKITSVEEEGE